MYQLLLCTRYLRTRYLAFVSIISVTLGVATLIVVNSVMAGFSEKLRDRLHGILSEVMVETDRADGFDEPPEQFMARVQASEAGKYIVAMSPTIETVAMLQFQVRTIDGRKIPITKHVRLVGVDPKRHAAVGGFADYLVRQQGQLPSFDLTADAEMRHQRNLFHAQFEKEDLAPARSEPLAPRLTPPTLDMGQPPTPDLPPPAMPEMIPLRVPGIILGYSIAHNRYTDPETGKQEEIALLREGDDVFVATVGASGMQPVAATFIVADFFRAEMSEYDNSFVYAPLDDLQQLKGMGDRVNSYQIKLKPEAADDDHIVNNIVIPAIQKLIPRGEGRVISWKQNQGSLLAAIDVERGLLNVLLFMIVGVAGFSVLAIFSMIVSEKVRDIGVLKSLGASSAGVARIFLAYGLLLGIVGCGLGTIVGLLMTKYLNEIEQALAHATGQQIFDRKIYYFDKIPTQIELSTVVFVNIGAVLIASVFSVLPAFNAARLRPVRALRFE